MRIPAALKLARPSERPRCDLECGCMKKRERSRFIQKNLSADRACRGLLLMSQCCYRRMLLRDNNAPVEVSRRSRCGGAVEIPSNCRQRIKRNRAKNRMNWLLSLKLRLFSLLTGHLVQCSAQSDRTFLRSCQPSQFAFGQPRVCEFVSQVENFLPSMMLCRVLFEIAFCELLRRVIADLSA